MRLQGDAENITDLLSHLAGLVNIKKTQAREYLIEYTCDAPDFDLQLLQCLRQNGFNYQQIYNGKTLENQLFD